MQLLLAARIACVDRAHRGHHVVVAINFVDENNARLGVFVGRGDDPIPNVRGEDHARYRRLFNRAIAQICRLESQLVGKRRRRTVRATIYHIICSSCSVENRLCPRIVLKFRLKPRSAINRIHEKVSYSYRNIEIRQACLIVLRVNKPQNIWVRDRENAHVCTAANAALLHDLGRLIDDIHERNRAGRDAACRIDHRACGPQKLVSHARAATGLVNDRDILCVFHDALDRIGDVQDKARRKLAFGFARIY